MFRVLLCLSSFPEHLKEKLEEYMARFSKVRIVRTRKREGLIRTRLLGASVARGEVLTFLDSHCEVNVNWLPPLLNQIALNHKTIVCPMIDVIDHNHFGYEAQAGDAMRGAFDWEMYYKRIPIPPELQRADPSDPFELASPTIARLQTEFLISSTFGQISQPPLNLQGHKLTDTPAWLKTCHWLPVY
nr:polypeptide N-acetylgalactosaminyltransferase-like 6 isoform X2 [Odocoileus virginianus texanus]